MSLPGTERGAGISGRLLLALLLSISAAGFAAAEGRWYTPEQAAAGAPLFQQNCAVCHGADAASTPNWRVAGPDGQYPPPPLNGTAHTWHHPLNLLRRIIREGGARVGGKMPPFQDKLNAAEIDAIIAFFQAKWPDNIYAAWLSRNKGRPQPIGKGN